MFSELYYAIVCSGGSTDSTTTASTATAVSTVASTGSEPEGDRQQGVSFTTLIGNVCRRYCN